MALLIREMGVAVDPLSDFRFDRRGQHALGPCSQNLCQHVLGTEGWKLDCRAGTLSHGGVLLGLSLIRKTKSNPSTPPFSRFLIHRILLYLRRRGLVTLLKVIDKPDVALRIGR